MSPFTPAKLLWLAAFVLFVIAGVICFMSTDVTIPHVLGIMAAGLACLAVAPLAT